MIMLPGEIGEEIFPPEVCVTADTSGPGPTGAGNGPIDNGVYLQLSESPEFKRLRHAFRRFVFPMTAAFLTWYLLYVVLSAYARDFMSTKVIGEINVALIFGLLQFVSTFLIAWAYERYSSRTLEPMADAVRAITPASVLPAAGATAEAPAEETPAAEAPAEEPPAGEPEAEEPAAEEAPAEESPAKETPAEETPAEEPAGETAAEEGAAPAKPGETEPEATGKPDATKKPDAGEEEGK
ncbi:DUF485 domain-containing protein [Spirillospora sp. NPDC047279]|uniref:DUF485 domain-containing protein n=1 Tax=Spirillospora sp. NPDC047279 TaxID=3155478 RepID=UPI0033C9C313